MRPETELLILCASPALPDAARRRIRDLAVSPLDGAFLEALAVNHRLLPLLHERLQLLAPASLPGSLDLRFRDNMRNNMLLTGELFRVLDLFDREGIAAIPFKGPTLALAAYGSLSLRSFDDLDILVHPADVWRARDLLGTLGYHAKLKLNPAREAAFLRSYDELILASDDGQSLLELHWAFVPPHFFVDREISDYWRRTSEVLIGNRTVPCLNPSDLLWVLALHAAKHGWSHLGLITDASWLIAKQPIDWDSLLTRARAAGILRMLLLPSALAARVFKIALPEAIAPHIAADPAIPHLVDDICAAWFGQGHDERAIIRHATLHMRMRERLADRVRYALRLASRPSIEDWQMIALPRSLAFLYPLLRLPRLAVKHLKPTGPVR